MDLGFSGPMFTWSNKQEGDALVQVRLDRAVVNGAFSALFDDCSVENIINTTSDHHAILIRLANFNDREERKPVQSGFRYEEAWLQAPDYRDTVERIWKATNNIPKSLQSMLDIMQFMAASLQDWSRVSFGSVRSEIKKLEKKLKVIRLQPINPSSTRSAQDIERRLCELFEREEAMARQRSRVEWLQ
jgi:hypothetical protein